MILKIEVLTLKLARVEAQIGNMEPPLLLLKETQKPIALTLSAVINPHLNQALHFYHFSVFKVLLNIKNYRDISHFQETYHVVPNLASTENITVQCLAQLISTEFLVIVSQR